MTEETKAVVLLIATAGMMLAACGESANAPVDPTPSTVEAPAEPISTPDEGPSWVMAVAETGARPDELPTSELPFFMPLRPRALPEGMRRSDGEGVRLRRGAAGVVLSADGLGEPSAFELGHALVLAAPTTEGYAIWSVSPRELRPDFGVTHATTGRPPTSLRVWISRRGDDPIYAVVGHGHGAGFIDELDQVDGALLARRELDTGWLPGPNEAHELEDDGSGESGVEDERRWLGGGRARRWSLGGRAVTVRCGQMGGDPAHLALDDEDATEIPWWPPRLERRGAGPSGRGSGGVGSSGGWSTCRFQRRGDHVVLFRDDTSHGRAWIGIDASGLLGVVRLPHRR